jgi:hypothetical protein
MQTFVPYGSNFRHTAEVLDRQRLGKQRVEAWQIVKALTTEKYGWKNHPAVKMWDGHVPVLAQYGIAMCQEWIARGYADTMLERFIPYAPTQSSPGIWPDWIDNYEVLLSHRSNLIRKRPDIYGMVWPEVPDDLPYIWPTPSS